MPTRLKKALKSRSLIKAVKAAPVLAPTSILLLWFIIPMSLGITNTGNVFGAAFCVGTILTWAAFPLIKRNKRLYTAFKILLGVTAAGFAWAAFLTANMLLAVLNNTPNPSDSPEPEYTVIVLGCQARNGEPSAMLAERLDTALQFLNEHESALCITTGGYGAGQSVSEAEVGRNRLTANNICESRIFMENASTSTLENLEFAREIMLAEDLPRDTVIISDGFHLWRASLMAADCFDGEGQIYTVPARTRRILLPTYWVREWLAITHYLALG
jgi:uncharacterized SAM-binding protein YcdF (DUF218 family)